MCNFRILNTSMGATVPFAPRGDAPGTLPNMFVELEKVKLSYSKILEAQYQTQPG